MILVVYKSDTGFTKQYAEWIGEALNCDIEPLKNIKAEKLEAYDTIIFGGWIMGKKIVELDKICRLTIKKPIVFAVGVSHKSEQLEREIVEINNLHDTPFYYMEGGFRFEELSFVKRQLLKTLKKAVSKKENKTEEESFMAEVLCTSFDNSSIEQIENLVEYVRNKV